jgi:hypothetical protein
VERVRQQFCGGIVSKAGDVRVVVSATVAMHRGTSYVAQCNWCGVLVAVPTGGKRRNKLTSCPSCARNSGWVAVPVPVGPFKAADDRTYTSPEVCELVGVSYRQLDYWTRKGIVRPSIADSKGSGHTRYWSIDDVARIDAIKRGLDAGLVLAAAVSQVEAGA